MFKIPLSAAVRSHDGIAHALLEVGANANHMYGSPLIAAAQNRLERTVRVLLLRGADANRRDYKEGTPLTCATGNGNERNVQILLEAGFDTSIRHRKSEQGNPLVAAARKGFEQITKQLIPAAT